ncbi:uncharacterized protein LAJ45_00406 [Morchella importuna]|uniref:uncharacterized protein n=1 Tax=Morchella importuna TaxID=1174673 RepID=UPI001E8EE33F|nr:uncharacterized protein LAJ45_00406 [Morchella importuna]KAH8155396.1 hypothetical protein LAJ45_00406 [Morchella importuna]
MARCLESRPAYRLESSEKKEKNRDSESLYIHHFHAQNRAMISHANITSPPNLDLPSIGNPHTSCAYRNTCDACINDITAKTTISVIFDEGV